MTLLCATLASVVLIAGPQNGDPATDYKRLIDEYLASGVDSVPKALLEWPHDRLLVVLEETVSDRKPSRDAPFHPAVSFDGLFRWLGAAATAHSRPRGSHSRAGNRALLCGRLTRGGCRSIGWC